MSKKAKAVRVPPVEQMDTETFIRHLEHRHAPDLAMEFKTEPGREAHGRRLLERVAWETYHALLHKWSEDGTREPLDHFHDYPHVAKTARPRGAAPGTIVRDKQSQDLIRWDGSKWAKINVIDPAPQRLAIRS